MKEEVFNQIEEYAKKNNIPITTSAGLDVLLTYLDEVKPKFILEIGTAIGYSALKMSEKANCKIITFEREKDLAKKAKENIRKLNKEKEIIVIEEDFLEYNLGNSQYDFIYVDGAKAQYYNFFKHFEKNINDKTIVIFDNLDFHGYVYNDNKKQKASKNLKQLIRKIEIFLEKIPKEKGYNFKYINKGDGIGVLTKENNEQANNNIK